MAQDALGREARVEEGPGDEIGRREDGRRRVPVGLLHAQTQRVGGVGGVDRAGQPESRDLLADDLPGELGVRVGRFPHDGDPLRPGGLCRPARARGPQVHDVDVAPGDQGRRAGVVPGEGAVAPDRPMGDAPPAHREGLGHTDPRRQRPRDARGDDVDVVTEARQTVDLVPGRPPDPGCPQRVREREQHPHDFPLFREDLDRLHRRFPGSTLNKARRSCKLSN